MGAKNNLFRMALFSLVVLFLNNQAEASEFKAKFKVDLNKYIGLWYEAGRTPNKFEDNILERDGEKFSACYNATANYTLNAADEIGVHNRCTRRSKKGTTIEDTIKGVAVVEKNSDGRKLQIAFGSGVARFFQRAISGGGFDYWIYCLGGVNKDGLYDWAVVSDQKRDYIFILTRDKFMSNEKRKKILACARAERLPVEKLIYKQQ